MGVLVLGMHRSGTSALAGALGAMGFDVGPDDDVMPADAGNPEGYFELLSVVRANDDLLAHFGGRWDSPPEFAPGWSEDDSAIEFVDAARAALSELFENDHFLLKDPRISILLPLWRRITNDSGCAVVIVRDPLEVAASLTRRNGLPTLTGLALWAHYNRTMLRDLHGARVHVCNYADLVENPDGVLTDIAASLRAWGRCGLHVRCVAARDHRTVEVDVGPAWTTRRVRHGNGTRARMVGGTAARRAAPAPAVGARAYRRVGDAQHESPHRERDSLATE